MRDFWNNARGLLGDHPVYRDHGHRLSYVIPVALHADEGRGVLAYPSCPVDMALVRASAS